MNKAVLTFATVVLTMGWGLAEDAAMPAAADHKPSRPEMVARDAQLLKAMQSRVAVLQDLLTQETDRLRKSEEQFCKGYNLDLQTFREGRYEYKAKKDQFIIVPPPNKKETKDKKSG